MANNRTLIIDNLKVCHVNCQFLVAHLDEFRTFFRYSGYHIICLSETWLRPEVTNDFVNLDGYQLHRWDRVGRGGGGVAFYLREPLRSKILKCSAENYCHNPEFLLAEIHFKNSAKLLLAVVYRPPHCGNLQELFDTFRDLSVLYSHSVIFGDFNADLSTASFDTGRVLDFVDCASLYLIPYTNTHHTRSSSTWLDLCIVDDSDKVVSYGQHDVSFLSSHDLIHITYKIKVDRTQAKDIWARDFRTFDVGEFTRDLLAKNWNRFYEVDSVDHKVELFNSFLLESFDLSAHERLIRSRKLPAPWLSEDIKRRMRERDRVRRQWRRHKCDRLHSLFKDLRNEVQILVRNAKKSYFTNFFSNCNDPGTAWNELRHLGIIKSKNSARPLPCSTEELNLYFFSTGDRGEALDSVLPCIGGAGLDEDKFFWSGVTPEEVVSALSGASSRARGIDGLPSRLLRIALPCLLPEMLHIFESSFTLNTFPTLWKRALVVPLPKVQVPEAPQHYRPISILCSISKVLEKIAARQITAYLERLDRLDPFQSAYKRGFSTQTALIRVLDDVRSAADKRMVTVSVFFDFSKAFDCVSHRLLITKLAALGFSNSVLHWLGSYLSDRCQAVRDTSSGKVSFFIEMGSGVPQGSVLGPLLFSLFLSDFRHVLQHCKYNFYADDLQIYLHSEPNDIHNSILLINEDIERIIF
ncbi:PREDICTED: RNA-directed DNA polymerase from mobile element jockey-like [Vollenhovia emeryi]|uniref:RNA-directed DNA polymerase from mobile element jockey-like n=1 Tax=Vollenhovia emeryi TaxID=411798 RepID=UPI0005F3F333|nr:PREDICTED: RNA-directed DNA polymerase from mobile element jockey-like [Vollenhovia emeryi]